MKRAFGGGAEGQLQEDVESWGRSLGGNAGGLALISASRSVGFQPEMNRSPLVNVSASFSAKVSSSMADGLDPYAVVIQPECFLKPEMENERRG